MLLALRLEVDIPEEAKMAFSDADNLELISDNEDIVDKLLFDSKMLAVVLETVAVDLDKTMVDDGKIFDAISEAGSVIIGDLFVKLMFLVADLEADILGVNEIAITDFKKCVLDAAIEISSKTLLI